MVSIIDSSCTISLQDNKCATYFFFVSLAVYMQCRLSTPHIGLIVSESVGPRAELGRCWTGAGAGAWDGAGPKLGTELDRSLGRSWTGTGPELETELDRS